ncbi:MAG: autotransporter outer membrane beta-barrel domain-containing protein [Rhodospirillaceae bacterium]|nr:MAG: autotransporter outer membrane beta-barrel domain-containing protein [Rhodospirillaceae bacterium]
MESGSDIIGAVDATAGKNDMLTLGGKVDGSFDVSTIGPQYQGFESFTVDAHSAWTLTGTTKETTNWVVSNGALQVSDDASLGAAGSTVTLDGGQFHTLADLSLSHDMNVTGISDFNTDVYDVTMDGQLSGGAQLNKFGSGTLILTADSSGYAAPIAIGFGTVMIGDASHTGAAVGGDVNLSPNGTLAGYGLVGGNVSNVSGGIVAPGGLGTADADIGTLKVAGNYDQSSTSTLRIVVTPNGASHLAVNGMADLGDGNLKLVFAPGTYTTTNRTIMSSAGLNNSRFDPVVQQNGGGAYGGIDYDATDVTLHVLDGSDSGGTVTVAPENGQVMGSTSTTVVLGAQASTRALFGHLNDRRLGTTDDSLRTAFAGSNPKQLAFAGDLAELNEVLAELPQALAQNGGWFRAIGGFGSIDGNNGASDINSYGGGFMAGYDRQVTDTLLLGAAVGFSRTQIEQDGSDATVNTPRLSLYSSYQYQHVALDLSLGYGYDRIKMRNQSAGGTAKSEHDAHELVAAVQAGYAIDLPSNVVLTPRVGVDYLHLFEDGYKESGAGAFDLEAESSDTDSLKPHVGVSVAKTFATDNGWNLTPEMSLTYSREMLDDSHQAQVLVGGGSFTVEGVKLTRDELALGTELTAQMSQTFELFSGYTAVLPIGNTVSHNFEAGLRAEF